MRALITGHRGFIGRHITHALHKAGYATTGIDTVNEHMDVRKLALYSQEIDERYDLVVHAAALVDGRETIDHKAALLGAYNLQLDGALFEWALRARPGRIVYFSSSAVYPIALQNPPYGPAPLVEERFGCGWSPPDQTYGWVKLTGETIAAEVRAAGIPVTVVRPFSGYGEDQDACYPFPAMITRAARRDTPFTVWGDGKQVRDFVHVDDICGAVLALIDAEVDGPVNIGTGLPTSMDDLARECMRQVGYTTQIRHRDDKPSGVRFRVADTRKLRQFYEPKVSLEEGVRRALACSTR